MFIHYSLDLFVSYMKSKIIKRLTQYKRQIVYSSSFIRKYIASSEENCERHPIIKKEKKGNHF